jgi:hypothetical protein
LQHQEERKHAKPSRPYKRRKNNKRLPGICNMFICDIWNMDDFMLQEICGMFELQPSILHGDLPFWIIFEAL